MSDYFLADDLSGALDAAAAFRATGRQVVVALSTHTWPEVPNDAVIGVTTETRNASAAVAAAIVERIINEATRRGDRIVYKKIDSTLRGPMAAELGAVMAALPDCRILFAPANPAAGRTVRDGVLLVRGIPVAQTEFGHDPVWPITQSSVRALLGIVGERVTIVDAETGDNLADAVAAMDRAGDPWVAVGSGALARPVAARMRSRSALTECPDVAKLPAGPTLMVCGSAHRGNREQAATLARARGVPVQEVHIGDLRRTLESAMVALQLHPGMILLAQEQRAESAAIVAAIASTVEAIVERTNVRRLFVTGGETAFSICHALGVEMLTFGHEIEPGSIISSGKARCGVINLAVKPGGFGDAETWVRAWDALRRS